MKRLSNNTMWSLVYRKGSATEATTCISEKKDDNFYPKMLFTAVVTGEYIEEALPVKLQSAYVM